MTALSAEDVADILEGVRVTYTAPGSARVVVVDGFGVRVGVERGALEVSDGVGEDRRTRRFEVVAPPERVVVTGEGTFTTQAARLVPQPGHGRGGDLPRRCVARRLPARAQRPSGPKGTSTGPRCTGRSGGGAAPARGQTGRSGQGAPGHLRRPERRRDRGRPRPPVWRWQRTWTRRGSWRRLPPQRTSPPGPATPPPPCASWARTAAGCHPHWCVFDSRRSAITGATNTNRLAERPLNALLNLTYKLAEVEARFALVRLGLDPGLGVLHLDAAGRDSLALDVLEPVRPRR